MQHDARAVTCDPDMSAQLKSAANTALGRMVSEFDGEVPALMSGAGHDAMAISHLTKVCDLSAASPSFSFYFKYKPHELLST